MQKVYLNISIVLFVLITFASCNSEKKAYESESPKRKSKGSSFALTKFNKLLKSNDTEAKYTAAVNYFDKKDYSKALMLFEELMNLYRGTARSEEVHFYYANCNYFLEDYILAGYQFRTFVKNFPSSKHTEYCAYMNAYCFYLNSPEYSLEQTDTYLAIKEFEHFAALYQKSDKIPECNEMLDKLRAKLVRKSYESCMLYYNMENYKSAIAAFADHIKEYPDSPHEEEFKFLTVKSHYLYAVNSIESKKEERFNATIESYLKFVERYSTSKYIKEAVELYSNSLKYIAKINKSTS